MPDRISCPFCRRLLRLDLGELPRSVRCPACAGVFDPHPPEDPPPAEPPPADEPLAESEPAPGEASPPRSASYRRKLYLAGGVLACLGLLVVAIVSTAVWFATSFSQPGQLVLPGDDDQLRQEAREAYRPGPGPATPEQIEDVKPFFDALTKAAEAKNVAAVSGLFDHERMFDELASFGVLSGVARLNREDNARGFADGLAESLASHNGAGGKRTEVRAVRRLNANEAIILARHYDAQGEVTRLRWWLTRRGGSWKAFDLEEVDFGLRSTVEVALGMAEGVWRSFEVTEAVGAAREAMAATSRNDLDAAERHLASSANVRLPPHLQAIRLLALAGVHIGRGNTEQALLDLAAAQSCHPGLPYVEMLRGIAYNGQNRWAEALPHLEAYRDLLGDDCRLCEELGTAYQGLGRPADACAAYRRALDVNPGSVDSFLRLLRALGGLPRDDVPDRFVRIPKLKEAFVSIASDCDQRKDHAGLIPIARRMKLMDESVLADYNLALAHVWAEQPGEAVKIFRATLDADADADQRKDWVKRFLHAMADEGRAAQAYDAVPDKAEAFRLLAAKLREGLRRGALWTVIAAHAKKSPTDLLLPFYRGEAYIQDGLFARAESAFAAGMKRSPPRDVLDDFRAGRVEARFRTGKSLSAYESIGPRRETFAQLAALHLEEDDLAGLESLVTAHVRQDAADPALPRFRWILRLRQGRVPEAVDLFKQALARETQPEPRDRAVAEFLHEMVQVGAPLEGYRAAPAPESAFNLLAESLEEEGRTEELRQLIAAHRTARPSDPALAKHEAELHLSLEEWDKAGAAFAAVLASARPDQQAGPRYSYAHAMYRAGRWREAYQRYPTSELFNVLANRMLQEKKAAELEALLALYRLTAPEALETDVYQARLWLLQGRADDAIALHQKLRGKLGAEYELRGQAYSLVYSLGEMGRIADAYRMRTRKDAFPLGLARQALAKKRTGELVEVLDQHARVAPRDPAFLSESAELYLARGDLRQAEWCYNKALSVVEVKYQKWSSRHGLNRVKVKAGQTVRAYRDAGGGRPEFDALVQVCIFDRQAGQLEALLGAHRKADPDDPALLLGEAECRWLKKDHAGAVAWIRLHRSELVGAPARRYRASELLVRGLVRTKRADEAVREATTLTKGRGDALLLLLAHAASGDLKQAVALAGRKFRQEGSRRRLYGDEDLGPILRGEAFQAFRDRFPEPKGGSLDMLD